MAKMPQSDFLELYTDEAVKMISAMNPEWNEDDIQEIVIREMKKSFSNPDVTIENNYTHQAQDTKLLSIIDWSLDRKPILAGNGTFFKNQHESINPTADMLDWFLGTRKKVKKEMFSLDETSREYALKDLEQAIWKVLANSYYGSSGMSASAFYNKFCAAATTASAQSVISTCYSTFEAFLANNFFFYNINECFDWINRCLELQEEDPETDDWIVKKDACDVFDKMKSMFIKWKKSYEEPLTRFLQSLDEIQLTRIYYRNNFEEFTMNHPKIQKLHNKILKNVIIYPILNRSQQKDSNWEQCIPIECRGRFESARKYNSFAGKESFMNPNDVPDSIKDDLKKLCDYYMKYVYTKYMVFDRIYRLKNFKRKTVVIIDTDSNILALDHYVDFVRSFTEPYGKPKENEEFIIINTIAYILTAVSTSILLYYGELSNVPEEFRPFYNMKNEFFMNRIIIANVKKRYMSLFKLREGNLLNPPKPDIKGFDFVKASTADACEERFKDIVNKYLLNCEDIDVLAIRHELEDMEQMVAESIDRGELEFLPNASAKELSAYKDPASEQSVRGMLVWNMLYPDRAIEPPSKVKLLKLTLFNENDLEPIKQAYPDIYETLMDKVFNDKSGIFVSEKYKNGKIERKSRGVQVLSIPMNAEIPNWVRPFIDIDTMIASILAPFKSVTELLKMVHVTTGFTANGVDRKNDTLTNIIKF